MTTDENLQLLESEQGHDIFFRNSDRRFVVRYFANAGLGDKEGSTESNERELNEGKVRERVYDTFDAARQMVWTRIETHEKTTKTPLNLAVISEFRRKPAIIKGTHGGNGSLLFTEKGADKHINTETYGSNQETAFVSAPVVEKALADIHRRRAIIAAEEQAIKNIFAAIAPCRVQYSHRNDGEAKLVESHAKATEAAASEAVATAVGAAIWGMEKQS